MKNFYMETVTYKRLVQLLSPLRLILWNNRWRPIEEEKVLIEADLAFKSLRNNSPTLVKGALHGSITGTGETLDELANDIFQKMLTGKVLLGSYHAFTEIIEWDKENGRFDQRLLTREELVELNCAI